MLLSETVTTSGLVAATSGRLEKIEHLAGCLRRLGPDEIETGVAFLVGELRQGRIGVGYAALRGACAGGAAPSPALTLAAVDVTFDRVASTKGAGSAAERVRLLGELFSKATREEQEFLARLVLGELRQGALGGLMVEAIARATDVPVADVRRARMLAGDLLAVARSLLTRGADGVSEFTVQLLRPIQPMLAQAAEDVSEALSRLKGGAFEFKLDGVRVQVHKAGEEIRVFTRRLNDVTRALPEIVERVRRLPVREAIFDGEVLAFRGDGRPHPFQTTMRRFGRKLDVERMRESLPLTPFFFDCLFLEGESLIDQPGEARFLALSEALAEGLVIPRIVTGDVAEAERFLEDALRRGHEGIMAKALEATYEAGARGRSWLKVKPSHTLDLVVLAAEWGHGRRSGRLSNLHLGARDPGSGEFVMLGKTFKGLTDDMLAWQTQKLEELATSRDAYTVYVRPELVLEIAFDGVQASPHYPAGMALRFARVKRYRADKRAEDADTIDTVRAILEMRNKGR